MSKTEHPNEITLNDLRANDEDTWKRASLELYTLVTRVIKIVIPHASESEVKDYADPIIANIATQIMRPRTEAFVRVQTWSDVGNLSARIARQDAIDQVRKNEVRQRESNIDRIEETETSRLSATTPSDKASSHELQLLLLEALQSLGPDDEKLLQDFYFEGKGTRQIAKEYGTTNGAICPRLTTARKRWGIALQELGVNMEELRS